MDTFWFYLTVVGIGVGIFVLAAVVAEVLNKGLDAIFKCVRTSEQPAQPGPSGQNGGSAKIGPEGANGSIPKIYGLEDLRADLTNAQVSVEDILAKCGDLDPDEIEKVVKELGSDRKAQRLAWFVQASKNQKMLQLTSPPVRPMVVKGSMEICRYCADRRQYARNQGYGHGPRMEPPHIPCDFCGGKGYYFIQRG
jgi:hypothetical protein